MKQLLDFVPLIAFFVAFKTYDIYVATMVLMGATTLQIVLTKLIYKTVEKMHLITLAMVMVFGGMTLWFQDEMFLLLKPTIIYLVFAIGLQVTDMMGNNLPQKMLGEQLKASTQAWKTFNRSWVGFFGLLAGLNLYVAFNFDIDTWVNFKTFWLFGITLAFSVISVGVLAAKVKKASDEQ